jgi:hypothetical protein
MTSNNKIGGKKIEDLDFIHHPVLKNTVFQKIDLALGEEMGNTSVGPVREC